MSIHCLPLLLYYCQIFFRSLSAMSITFLQCATFKILWENFLLENFCDSELSSSFHFKSFKFFDFVIEIKYNISFFQHLSIMLLNIQLSSFLFFFCCRNHHSFIRSINLKEYSHLFSGSIFPLFIIFKPLVLIICVFIINQMV